MKGKKNLKQMFTIGVWGMVILLAILNFQILGLTRNITVTNNAISGLVIGSQDQTGQQPTPTPQPPAQQQQPISLDAREIIGDSPTLGDSEAPVVLISWNDFRCGFCGRFKEQTLPSIIENYVESGEVLYVFKHFPVVGGEPEALASLCANEQGKFWEFHDKVFEASNYNEATFSTWAAELGMDVNEFESCFRTARFSDKISQDAEIGMSLGIRGTPGFLVNDELVSGAQPYQVFEEIIESKLRG